MDMDFPVGKANRLCDWVEIHCCTHPVEMVDGEESREERRRVQGTAGIQVVDMILSASHHGDGKVGVRSPLICLPASSPRGEKRYAALFCRY
ncbi:hypothetical protein [Rhizobium sp. R635]|uniref:hypothetical protein n=1 Tax=Rhizobium sp. R635 TaxID=1764275 RepID=UPI00167D4D1F|nr:hypothetical protein [Rhizobium sp. R635]